MRRLHLERLWALRWRALAARLGALPRGYRWAAYSGLSLGALLALGGLVGYLVARSSIRNLEQRYHASLSIGAVLPCGAGICARGIKARFEDAPGLTFEADKVRLSAGVQNEGRLVLVDGATVSWQGTLAQVEEQARALGQRFGRGPSAGEAPKAKGSAETTVRAQGASFSWRSPDGDGLQARGLEIERAGGELRVFADEAQGSVRRNGITLSRGRLSLRRVGSSNRFVSAEAHELRIEQSERGPSDQRAKGADADRDPPEGSESAAEGEGGPPGQPGKAAERAPSGTPAKGAEHAPSGALAKGAEHAPSGALAKGAEHAPSGAPAKGAEQTPADAGAMGAERAPSDALAKGAETGRKLLEKRRKGAPSGKGAKGAKHDGEGSPSERSGGAADVERPPAEKAGRAADAPRDGASLLDKARVLREAMPRVRAALAQLEAASVEDARISIDALYATFVRGGVTVHLGPNTVNAFRTPTSFRLDVTPQAVEQGPTSLKLGVEVPADAAADVRVSLTGGPVPLAALGLRKGDLGLLDVEHSLVEAAISTRLTGDGRRATAEVDAKLHDLSVEQPALSSEPIRGAELRLRGDVALETDGSSLVVERGELGVGRAAVAFSGSLSRPGPGFWLRGRVEVPSTPCQAALDALPKGLSPMIAGMRMSGAFSLVTAVDFDSSKPEQADVHFALGNGCKVVSVPPEVDVKRFREPFVRRVYGPDRSRVELEMGPGTPGWVRYGAISPFMTAAVLTTEDGGFRHHHGFDAGAIRNSIRDNLREGRFLRGASTITMQTVKNLYLEREKTLGRKIQEAVLTVYLEQALTKEEILELYFNCIEFGPMLYGIGSAAGHYFHSTPQALSLGQALYLSSILPNPKNNYFGPDGRVKPHWMAYLRKLMHLMVKRHLIDESELRLAASESVVFGEPAPLREDGLELDSLGEVFPMREGP